MPHKCISYSISVNGGEYSSPQNLGDDSSYIYIGTDLEIGDTDSFKLKLWVNEEWGMHANNKTLKSLIEVTLYSENPIRNYIMYDTQGGSRVTKTNIIAKRISMIKPLKKGYEFLGWSTRKTGEVEYLPDDLYQLDTGITLYAVWEEGSITYDLNGGIGDIPSNKISEGITSIIPTKEGYVFKGWSKNKDATEAEYTSGSAYIGSSVTLYAIWYIPPSAAETIIENVVSYSVANPTTFTGGLVAVNTAGTLYNETDTTQTIREYRYSGPSVNNYVYFNCADTAGGYNYGDANYPYNETNCELWRIVGVFKNSTGEWNLKLMRNTLLQASELTSTFTVNGTTYKIQYSTGNNVHWNKKTSGTNNNDWTTAGLQYFLNKEQDSNGVNGYYSTIASSSKSLIDENYTYYLGNVVYGSSGDTTITAYKNERDETKKHSGNQHSWSGTIGLLYSSDVGYAAHGSYWSDTKFYNYSDNAIVETSWMMQNTNHSNTEFLISPSSSSLTYAILWMSSGIIHAASVAPTLSLYGARPVLNLKSETTSLEGRDGSINLPYVFIGK